MGTPPHGCKGKQRFGLWWHRWAVEGNGPPRESRREKERRFINHGLSIWSNTANDKMIKIHNGVKISLLSAIIVFRPPAQYD